MDTPEEKRIASLKVHMIASLDLQEAMDALAMAGICEPRQERIRELLTHYAVIAYARPFSPGKSGTRVSGKFEKFDDVSRQSFHDQVIQMRHKVVGHNDAEYFSVEFTQAHEVVVAFREDGVGKANVQRGTIENVINRSIFEQRYTKYFEELCLYQKHRIDASIARERSALAEVLKQIPPQDSLLRAGLKFSKCSTSDVPKP